MVKSTLPVREVVVVAVAVAVGFKSQPRKDRDLKN